MSHLIRAVTCDDASELAELLRVNRGFLEPWEPVRDDAYFTPENQREVISAAVAQHESGSRFPV